MTVMIMIVMGNLDYCFLWWITSSVELQKSVDL